MPPNMGQQGGPNSYRQPGPQGQDEPLQVNSVIARKPVVNGTLPARGDSLRSPREDLSLPEQSSSGSFTAASIDSSIMNQIQGPSRNVREGMSRHDTMTSQVSSNYGDNASTASPDYASARPSMESQASIERPRAGVLKTIGSAGSSDEQQRREFDMPQIDFGPTVNYAAQQRSKTPTGVPNQPGASQASHSAPSSGLQTHAPAPGPQRRSPGPQAVSHDRQGSNDTARRSMIWQPPSAPSQQGGLGGSGMSAEQFVQHRAIAQTPQYAQAHHRQSSSVTLSGYRAGTPTPPLNRPGSQDYIGIAHSRNNSQELLQRPGSRSAGDVLQRPSSRELLQRPNSRNAGDILQRPSSRGAGAVLGGQSESHLSAREQEQVARATGSPLIQMAGSRNGPQAGGGLVGAIHTREREREQAKQGWANASTQQAIQQRQLAQQQQQQQQQQMLQQQQQQQQAYQQFGQTPGTPGTLRGPPPLNGYSNLGGRYGGLQSPMQQGFGMQQGYFPALAGGFEQPGGWTGSAQGGMSPPVQLAQQGYGSIQQPVMQINPHQAQFVQAPQQGQYPTQGQGGQGYHGQAF